MIPPIPMLAEIGSIEKVVITALAVAGGFLVGFLLSDCIMRLLFKFVWKKEAPVRLVRFIRFAGGLAAALLVYLLLQGEGGLGLGGRGGGNPTNPNEGKDNNQNPIKQDDTKQEPKKEELKPKDKPIETKSGVIVVYLLKFDAADQRLFRIGKDPKPMTLDEVLQRIEDYGKTEKLAITQVDIEAGDPEYSVQALTLLESKLSKLGIKSTRPTMKDPASKN